MAKAAIIILLCLAFASFVVGLASPAMKFDGVDNGAICGLAAYLHVFSYTLCLAYLALTAVIFGCVLAPLITLALSYRLLMRGARDFATATQLCAFAACLGRICYAKAGMDGVEVLWGYWFDFVAFVFLMFASLLAMIWKR